VRTFVRSTVHPQVQSFRPADEAAGERVASLVTLR